MIGYLNDRINVLLFFGLWISLAIKKMNEKAAIIVVVSKMESRHIIDKRDR